MSNARCDFLGHKFRARGCFVTTVGRDEEVIRAYIRNQELADQQLDQLELKISAAQKIQSIVLTSLKTAFGGSQSNLQLCWRLLAHCRQNRFFQCVGELLPRPARRGSEVEARTIFARDLDEKN